MTAAEKLERIQAALEEGHMITISTRAKSVQVTQKTVDRFRESGYELFKVMNNSLYLRRGKSWDCIDYTKIECWE